MSGKFSRTHKIGVLSYTQMIGGVAELVGIDGSVTTISFLYIYVTRCTVVN